MTDKLMRTAKKMYKSNGAKKKDGMHRPEGAGNFDNMDDYNVVNSIDVNEGKIQNTPSNDKDIVNKEYVDDENDKYVKKAGDTMTGNLNISKAAPTLNFNLATTNEIGQYNFQEELRPKAFVAYRGSGLGTLPETLTLGTSIVDGKVRILTANNVPAIDIDENQQVGIGTATPQQLLHLSSSTDDARIRLETTQATSNASLEMVNPTDRTGSVLFYEGGTADANLRFNFGHYPINSAFNIQTWTGAAWIQTFNILETTGLVGIGSLTPATTLEVKNTGGAYPATSGSTQSAGHKIRVRATGSSVMDMGMFGGNGGWIQVTDDNNHATNYPLMLNPNSGNVGVGTTVPSRLFQVGGDGGTAENSIACIKGGKTTGYSQLMFGDGDDDNVGRIFYSHAANDMIFNTNDSTKMTLKSAGRLGINTTTPDTKLQVVGDCKFGDDNTNYASFASDGELTLTGTARVNKEFSLLLSDFNPGASGPTKALNDIFPTYEFTIDDDMHTSFEMPDDWAVGTDLTCEVYWAIDEAYVTNSGEVRWSADWRAVAIGEVISGGASGTMDFGDVNIPATANTIVKTTSTIAGGSLSADDLVAFNGARIDLVAGNNPTAEPYIIAVRLEYLADKLGEAT